MRNFIIKFCNIPVGILEYKKTKQNYSKHDKSKLKNFEIK